MKLLFCILIVISSQVVIVACDSTTTSSSTGYDCKKYTDCEKYFDIPKKEILKAICDTEPGLTNLREKKDYLKRHISKMEISSTEWQSTNNKIIRIIEDMVEILDIRIDMFGVLKQKYGMTKYDLYSECGWDTKKLDDYYEKYDR